MPDIFISYSRADQPKVSEIVTALEAEGYDVWWDTALAPGETFRGVIRENLKTTKCLIVVWSSASVTSNWVIEEAEEGLERDILVPVLIEDIVKDIPHGFRSLQAANLSNWKGELEDSQWQLLSDRSKQLVSKPSLSPKPYLPPAKDQKKIVLSISAVAVLAVLGGVFLAMGNFSSPGHQDANPDTENITGEAFEAVLYATNVATVNVYQATDTRSDVLGEYTSAQQIDVTARVEAGENGREWFRVVMADGRTGYVLAALLRSETLPVTADGLVVLDARETPASVKAPVLSVDAATLPDFSLFRECGECPEMVVIPGGNFMMGSPEGEAGREADEGPQQEIKIDRFAVARFETTWDEWAGCVNAGFCEQRPLDAAGGDNNFGRGQRPVIEVDWSDAGAFAGYVNSMTRGGYRRPTEAEWEYTARGGKETAYPWGETASHEFANYGKDQCCAGVASGRDQWVNTSPVGQFPANPFGIFDMHGNAWEWVEDCYRDELVEQPDDGSAVLRETCSTGVFRGGSWGGTAAHLRSANRTTFAPGFRMDSTGIRLVKSL